MSGWVVKRSEITDQQNQLLALGHLTLISGLNGVWENIFQLFRFTQQAQNSYLSPIFDDI